MNLNLKATSVYEFLMYGTIEHKQPRSKGGGGRLEDNIVLACRGCNWTKNNMTEQQFENKRAAGLKTPAPWVMKQAKKYIKNHMDQYKAEYNKAGKEIRLTKLTFNTSGHGELSRCEKCQIQTYYKPGTAHYQFCDSILIAI